MTVTTLPSAPQRNQTPAVFAANADALVAALPTFVTEVNAMQADVTTKQSQAETSAAAALVSEQGAAASYNAVTAATGVTKWISGTTYSEGVCVWSPIDFRTYRRKSTGAGTTDPSLDSTNWAFPVTSLPGAGGDITPTGNVTLLATSPAVQSITPSSPGFYLTLPDAAGCIKGIGVFVVENNGRYDYGIKNAVGTVLGWIKPGKTAVVSLASNSTSAGKWSITNLEKIGVTAQLVNNALTSISTNIIRVAIDSNRTCLLFGNSNVYAVVFDQSTATWGSIATVRTGVSSSRLATLSALNQVLVISVDSATGLALEAVTLSIDSTTGITVNSGTKGTTTLGGICNGFGQIKAVGSSFVFSYGRATNTSEIRAITVSGTTPTIGSAQQATSVAAATSATLYAMDSSVVLAIDATGSTLYAKPWTVSGSSLAAGTEASTGCTSSTYRTQALGSGNIVAFHLNTLFKGAVISVSGTVANISVATISSSVTPGNALNYFDTIAVNNTKLCVLYHGGSTTFGVNHLTDTAGTAGVGTEITSTTETSISAGTTVSVGLSGSTATFCMRASTNGAYLANIDTSGSSPVLSSLTPMVVYLAGSAQTPSTPDMYNTRSGRQVIAGGVLYTVSPTSTAGIVYGLQASSSGLSPILLPNVVGTNPPGTCAGAANETWFISSIGTASNGVAVCRVEAAA